MKKVVSFLPAVIFAMLISSCSIRTGEDVPDGWDVPAAGGVQLTITASGEAPGVRTVLHGGSGKDRNNVDFTASDALAVFDLEGNKSGIMDIFGW